MDAGHRDVARSTSKGSDASATATLVLEGISTLGDAFAGAIVHVAGADALPGDELGREHDGEGDVPRTASGLARLTPAKLRQSGEQRDFFFVVPYQEAPEPRSATS